MDVIEKETWANVGFVWDYDSYDDWYAFKYCVNGAEVDSSYYAVLSNIYQDAGVYPSKTLFGA